MLWLQRRDDRYYRRRDRSPGDRRRDDYYDSWDRDRDRPRDRSRPRERPRSRDRDRDRDRGIDRDRDRRNRSRDHSRGGDKDKERDKDRDGRRDKDRDRDRDSVKDKDRSSRKGGSRDRRDSKQVGLSPCLNESSAKKQSPAPAPMTEEEKIRQRKERLEVWKRKRAEEEEAKKNTTTPAALLSSLERPPVVEVAPKVTVATTQPKSPLEISPKSATSAPISSAARPKADSVVPVAISPAIRKFTIPAHPILRVSCLLGNSKTYGNGIAQGTTCLDIWIRG